jgi:hypothetical protein
LIVCGLAGVFFAWLWQLGYPDPQWRLDDPAFWLHLAAEGMVAFGIGGSLFVLSGAALRYLRAHRAARQATVDTSDTTQ